jgi:hypothetical protein
VERFVIRHNIEHCRAILNITADPAERRQIEKLLLEEEAKLEKYDDEITPPRPPLRHLEPPSAMSPWAHRDISRRRDNLVAFAAKRTPVGIGTGWLGSE